MFCTLKSKKKCLIYLILLSFVVYIINENIKYFDFRNHPLFYDVYSRTCKIQHFNPFDDNMQNYLKRSELDCNSTIRLVLSNETHLIINPKFKTYLGNNLSCFYVTFWRKTPKKFEEDNQVVYDKKHYYFNDTIKVNPATEYVKVTCTWTLNDTFQKNHKDYHAFVPVYRKFYTESNKRAEGLKMNVLIVGIDSVCRHHFYRQMPKTLDYLMNGLKAIEYLGYHRVGDNTFPNLIPVFSGQNIEELKSTCWFTKKDRFDKCDFIWADYLRKGYATAYIEEESWMGLFTYLKYGFTNQPTTHYWGPFSREAENDIGKNGLNTKLCWGLRPAIHYLLEYSLKFVRSYFNANQNFFATFWESSITHDNIEFYPQFDDAYLDYLQILNGTGVLNNTIMFFMSDHGFRYGSIVNSFQGRLEANLPMLYVVVPKWFKAKYPYEMKNLEKNTRKLTSHFDLHETLKTIVNQFTYITSTSNRGISLFRVVPEDRTCEDAGIPSQWCNCQQRRPISFTAPISTRIADFAVSYMNALFENHQNCSKLVLSRIIDAKVFTDTLKKHVGLNYYTVVFETNPGGGIFECTVRCRECKKDFKLDGPISRNNLYGNQSRCTNDAELKLYCFCKD